VILKDRRLDNTPAGMSFLKRLNKFHVENRTLYPAQ